MAGNRGHLIVFEGLDRSGKSTQCLRLVEHLRRCGRKVEHIRFPDRTTIIGQMINDYLSGAAQQEDHVIHLLFSANRWEAAENIKTLVNSGTDVVVDRYYYSGAVYSAAKQNPEMSLSWCRQQEVGLPRPDLCLFLDISTQHAAQRGGFGAERYEKRELQDRVRELFGEMRAHADEAEDIVVIDAGKSIEEVERLVQHVVNQRLDSDRASTPLRQVRSW